VFLSLQRIASVEMHLQLEQLALRRIELQERAEKRAMADDIVRRRYDIFPILSHSCNLLIRCVLAERPSLQHSKKSALDASRLSCGH
jgi:hypothetical protein